MGIGASKRPRHGHNQTPLILPRLSLAPALCSKRPQTEKIALTPLSLSTFSNSKNNDQRQLQSPRSVHQIRLIEKNKTNRLIYLPAGTFRLPKGACIGPFSYIDSFFGPNLLKCLVRCLFLFSKSPYYNLLAALNKFYFSFKNVQEYVQIGSEEIH